MLRNFILNFMHGITLAPFGMYAIGSRLNLGAAAPAIHSLLRSHKYCVILFILSPTPLSTSLHQVGWRELWAHKLKKYLGQKAPSSFWTVAVGMYGSVTLFLFFPSYFYFATSNFKRQSAKKWISKSTLSPRFRMIGTNLPFFYFLRCAFRITIFQFILLLP